MEEADQFWWNNFGVIGFDEEESERMWRASGAFDAPI
jgi:hypothetical protein